MGKQFDKTRSVIDNIVPAADRAAFYAVDSAGAIWSTLGGVPYGWIPWGGTANLQMAVVVAGPCAVLLAEDVTKGAYGTPDADGKAILADTASHNKVLLFLEAGSSGDVVEALVGYWGVV